MTSRNSEASCEGEALFNALLRGTDPTGASRWFNRMSRSARLIGPEVIELRSYSDARMRVLCWCIGLAAILIVGFTGVVMGRSAYPFQDQIDAYRVLTDFQGVIRNEYDRQPQTESFETYFSGVEPMISLHRMHAWRTFFGLAVVTMPFFLVALFWPKRAGLRLDRQRWLAYSVIGGELATVRIRRSAELATPLEMTPAPAPPFTLIRRGWPGEFGPLLIELTGFGSQKARLFWAGAQPVTNPRQNRDLMWLAEIFTTDVIRPETWLHRLKRHSFLPADLLRGLNRLSLRRAPDLDSAALQSTLDGIARTGRV